MSKQAAFTLFSNQTIAAGANVVSEPVSLQKASGYFSVNGTITGSDPNLNIEYLSGNGSNFVLSDSIIAASNSTTPFSIQFYPELSESIKIKVTNQSESEASVSLTLRFTEA